MDKALVSVCMITYNHEKYIQQAIEGVLKQQTNFKVELIISNDKSKDATHIIIQDLIKKNGSEVEIIYYEQPQNLGMMANFIFTLKKCQGKFIALCEGDDYWIDSTKLQKQVDFMEAHPDFGICFHRVQLRDEHKDRLIEDHITREVLEVTGIEELARGNFMHTPSVMVRNDFQVPEWFFLSPLGDWSFYMSLLRDRKIKKIDEVMGVYRLHVDGIWSGFSKEHRDRSTWEAVKLVYRNQVLPPAAKKVLKQRLAVYRNQYTTTSSYLERLKKLIRATP